MCIKLVNYRDKVIRAVTCVTFITSKLVLAGDHSLYDVTDAIRIKGNKIKYNVSVLDLCLVIWENKPHENREINTRTYLSQLSV